jgi:acyl-CoA reductase-like NAD-dependent aldehyde dehydrogenase
VPNLKKLLKETLISPEEFFKKQQENSEHPPAGNGHSSSQQEQKAHTSQHLQPAPSNTPHSRSDKSMGGPKVLPFYLANKPQSPNQDLDVTDKYTGEVAYKVALAGSKEIDQAIAAAVEAFPAMVALASYQRKEILEHCVNEFQKRFEELAMALCIEAGKPIKDSRGEVTRLIETFKISVEECTRIYGEYADMDISKRTEGFHSITRMFPIGPVSMVSPFNFPLNLTAHKVAPALAVGVPFVLKPASRTPIGALIIGEVLSTAPHLPKGAFSILPCSRDGADLFTTDDRFKLLTFTGSAQVGWGMKARAGKKKVVLELGGNAGCVIEDYRSEKELDTIIGKVIHGAFYQSGQSCISVQRLFVKKEHYDTVKQKLVPAVKELKMGDPKDENTFIGPIISEKEAQRIESWVKEAAEGGAKLLAGGNRKGVLMEATLLENVPKDAKVVRDEVFGPVLVMEPYDSFKQAIHSVNDSDYGLQAGVFTHDVDKAWYAFEHLDVGGVVLNHVPSVRVDAQPYGGVKDSGLGREGVRYSMKDMMEERVLMMVNVGKEDSF